MTILKVMKKFRSLSKINAVINVKGLGRGSGSFVSREVDGGGVPRRFGNFGNRLSVLGACAETNAEEMQNLAKLGVREGRASKNRSIAAEFQVNADMGPTSFRIVSCLYPTDNPE